MLYQDILGDEICVYASAIFLNIHVMIDFYHGFWTTLDLPEPNHDLAASLSNLYLAYHGLCKYSFLCQNIDLSTKGRKLLEHKLEHNQVKLQKQLKIELIRIEEYNATAENLINIELSDLNNVTTGSTTTPSIHKVEVEKPNLHKDIVIKIHQVEEWNPITKEKLDEQLNSSNYDSEDTEIYSIKEQTIRTITFIENKPKRTIRTSK